MNTAISKDIHRWIDDLIDDTICESDLVRLEAAMSVDAAVREVYYRRIAMDAGLRKYATDASVVEASKFKRRSVSLFALAMAVSLIIALMSVVFVTRNREPVVASNTPLISAVETSTRAEPSMQVEPAPQAFGFAVLQGQSAAVWAGKPIRMGELLPPGKLRLQSGLAQIELFSGVRIVMDRGTELTIDSPMKVTLYSGRVRAQVPPPAEGFEIHSAGGRVVDFGTEFVVDAAGPQAVVSVIDGEVELHPQTGPAKRLFSGDASRIHDGVDAELDPTDAMALVGPSDFESRMQSDLESRRDAWETSSARIDDDPAVLFHYQFGATGSRMVPNLADDSQSGVSQSVGSAMMVATRSAADRWGRSHAAVDLSRTGSRVRVNIPGKFHQLSMWCWVKIDSLDRPYNSLFLTDGHEVGEPHWQLTSDGRLFFSVKSARNDSDHQTHIIHSKPIWTIRDAGRWMMLAVVYNGDDGTCQHYVDGVMVADETMDAGDRVPEISIGSASIGNWNQPMYRDDPGFVIRNLNGSIDQFVMLDRVIAADEIDSIYATGSPSDESVPVN